MAVFGIASRALFMRRSEQLFLMQGVVRKVSSKFGVQYEVEPPDMMKCVQLHSYADALDRLSYVDRTTAPQLAEVQPDQALVKVMAASVNPIDIEMTTGYAGKLMSMLKKRKGKDVFPLILGGDFSGVIVAKGREVNKHRIGDEVWGVRSIAGQGTHAQYAIINKTGLAFKPKSLDHVQAASIPYVACTTWNALSSTGLLVENTGASRRVFVPAGTGGIGSFAVQLLKAYGHYVVTTCSTDGVPLVKTLGADCVIDYKSATYWSDLQKAGPFDVVFDTLRERHKSEFVKLLRNSVNSKYVSLRSSLLSNIEKHGLFKGSLKAGLNYVGTTASHLVSGKGTYHWGFFSANASLLDNILPLVEAGRIKPVVDRVYDIGDAMLAYKHVAQGNARGKTVIKVA